MRPSRTSRSAGLAVAATVVGGAAAAKCDCYSTNSSALNGPQYYTNYQFLDFRNITANDSRSDLTVPPPLVGDNQTDGSGEITSSYFTSPPFNSVFSVQNYTQNSTNNFQTSTVKLVNSAQNVYISKDNHDAPSQLTLRVARLQDFSSCGELDSNLHMLHASYRARARVTGAPGGVAGIFLYRNETSESDIEILTTDPTSAWRASNQPDVGADGNDVPGASTVERPPGFDYQEWTDYRLDWTPTLSSWYINGVLTTTRTYGIPRGLVMAMLNMWNNGGSWSGNMTIGDKAFLDVQWVEIVYNVTAENATGTCSSVCSVDSESQPGQPTSAAPSSGSWAPSLLSLTGLLAAWWMFV